MFELFILCVFLLGFLSVATLGLAIYGIALVISELVKKSKFNN